MARVRKCDRCGKLYEHYDGREKFKDSERANAVVLIDRDLDNTHWERTRYDFCPKCMQVFIAWFKSGGTEAENVGE